MNNFFFCFVINHNTNVSQIKTVDLSVILFCDMYRMIVQSAVADKNNEASHKTAIICKPYGPKVNLYNIFWADNHIKLPYFSIDNARVIYTKKV